MYIPESILEKAEQPPNCFTTFYKGVDIDPKIWPLVRVLNLKGIKTLSSCEGHYTDHPYPWIRFDISTYAPEIQNGIIKKLRNILSDYNKDNEIQWDVKQADKRVGILEYNLMKPMTMKYLEKLQETIPKVTQYINDLL